MAGTSRTMAGWTVALVCLGQLTTALTSNLTLTLASCGDGMCQCLGANVSCEGNDSATYLPMLPPQITWMEFSHFKISAMTPEVLKNVTTHDVKHLALMFFKLRYVDPNIFHDLPNITELDLSGSFIPQSQLLPILQSLASHTKLTHLVLEWMNLVRLDFLNGSTLSDLVYLDLEINHIEFVDITIFSAFPRLQELNLNNNDIKEITLVKHDSLLSLNLGQNQLSSMPNFCPESDPVFPELRFLRLYKNKLSHVKADAFRCLTRLELIDISHNDIFEFHTNTFSGLPNLQSVYMSHMTTKPRLYGYAFNNSHLQTIVINDNYIYESFFIAADVFAGCTNLSNLNIGNNELDGFPGIFLAALFAPLKSLKVLNLMRNELTRLPPFLYLLTELTHLYLSGNRLTRLNSTILSRLQCLQELDISENALTFVEENAIPVSLQQTLKAVDLHGNSFSCTCDILWLKDWIRTNTTRFLHYPDQYTCGSPTQGVRLADVVLTDLSCLLSATSRLLVVGCSAVLLLAVVVFSLVYRYRWHLQYLVFMARFERARRPADRANYRFDAFVAYSADDHEWVVTQLMPALEEAQGLRLCLHERDFLAGNLVVDNIVDNVAKSRRVLVVLSKGFARSEWCQFELNLAHRLALERGQDLMVVVMLEEVARADVTKVMYAVLKTITYITWPPEERDRQAFWTRLAEALK